MGGSFKIGRFSGTDVRLHWTFFLLLAFFAFLGYRASGSPIGALTATLTIAALFFCVLLHEFGHSLGAQRLGIGILKLDEDFLDRYVVSPGNDAPNDYVWAR